MTSSNGHNSLTNLLSPVRNSSKPSPFHNFHKEYPVALSNPNQIRDIGVDPGHAFAGTNKYGYRLYSPMANLAVRSRQPKHIEGDYKQRPLSNQLKLRGSSSSAFMNSCRSKQSKANFMSVTALDGLTNYIHPKECNKLYSKPLQYTFDKTGN